jgi:mono/diheme cytochrome c family protein
MTAPFPQRPPGSRPPISGGLLLVWVLMLATGCHGSEPSPGATNKNDSAPIVSAAPIVSVATVDLKAEVARGHQLYLRNCAHCHAPDATGDEGPDLHDVERSDARIAALIKNGVKGQMPKFSAKLSAPDIQALITFIRSLQRT